MKTLSPDDISTEERRVLKETASRLGDHSELAGVLHTVLSAVERGSDVVVATADVAYTTTQAAKLLGMSRPHLYKLLDDGEIPYTQVGTSRRLTLADLQEFIVRRDAARRELAETFAHASRDRTEFVEGLAGLPRGRRAAIFR